MDQDNSQFEWTEEQWNRVQEAVRDEARKVRVAASFLPTYGPLAPDAETVPRQTLFEEDHKPLRVDDRTTRALTTVSINVQMRRPQAAQTDLSSPMIMFRRAANLIARVEDYIIFRGQPSKVEDIQVKPSIFRVSGGDTFLGLIDEAKNVRNIVTIGTDPSGQGQDLVAAVVTAISLLEENAYLGPFALVLGVDVYDVAYTPNKPSLVLPADRIKPLLDGPLLRSSTIDRSEGVLVSLAGEFIDLVVARDIAVRFLHITDEARRLFRVSQRFTLRVKQPKAIVALLPKKKLPEEPEEKLPEEKETEPKNSEKKT